MNKKAKAQLLSELAQLDVERNAIYDAIKEGCDSALKVAMSDSVYADWGARIEAEAWLRNGWTDDMMERLHKFNANLCNALGIQHVDDGKPWRIDTTEPILGGDVGVATAIGIKISTLDPWDGGRAQPYTVLMSYEGLQVQYTAPMAVDLPVMLHRGYAALRVLRKGTINYHKS